MEKRLQQFLELEGLTPAKFSEIMGIQRSGISHLLAGRNKPSYDFIVKMISNFPNVNYEWLLLGKGKPFKDNSAIGSQVINSNVVAPQSEPQIFATEDFTDETAIPEPDESPIFDSEPDDLPPFFEENPQFKAREHAQASPVKHTDNTRRITRITVFYSDGTFEER
jgi:Plasmid maintenance system antidote protein